MTQPTLHTARLTLRPFELSDARVVQQLAGAPEVADTTMNVPHPYEDGMAEMWIDTHRLGFERGERLTAAITLAKDALVGSISLRFEPAHDRAELGYWIGLPHWNNGYATEAARALLAYGFDDHGVNRIYATHLTRNPASGRVMQKIGMQFEGVHRAHFRKNGLYEDVAQYAILRTDPRT